MLGWCWVGFWVGVGLGLGWGWVGVGVGLGLGWVAVGLGWVVVGLGLFPQVVKSIRSGGWLGGSESDYIATSVQPTGFDNRSECGNIFCSEQYA